MQLQFLQLSNFKNWSNQAIDLTGQLICLSGNNGMGKTNFLDSIHYLCTGQSYFQALDSLNVNHEADFFRIEGRFERAGTKETLTCSYQKGGKKQLKRNDVLYKKLAAHVGLFPVVCIAPDDMLIINGYSPERRKFLDFMLSNGNRNYLQQLIAYNRILKNRNAYLKQIFLYHTKPDEALLDSYDEQLVQRGSLIYEQRLGAEKELNVLVAEAHEQITESGESVTIRLDSQLLDNSFQALLKASRKEDIRQGRSTSGIHKDDFLMMLDGYEVRKFGSQGQKKSMLIALKLAQLKYLEKNTGQAPILLLDDLFDKLDRQRGEGLLRQVCSNTLNQVFITDTQSKRIPEIVQSIGLPLQILQIENAKIIANDVI